VCLSPDIIAHLATAFTAALLQHYSLWSYVLREQQAHTHHRHHLLVGLHRPAGMSHAAVPRGARACHGTAHG
jgi:hypothetical protein